MMDDICICIVNYKNGPATIQCLQTIFRQTLRARKIIVVDNCSGDDSVEQIGSYLDTLATGFSMLKYSKDVFSNPSHESAVTIIKAEKNGGYSYGNNIAIKYARKFSDLRYILIINNDVLLEDTALLELKTSFLFFKSRYKTEKVALGAKEFNLAGKCNHHGYHYLHLLSGLSFPLPLFPWFKYIVGALIFLPIDAPLMDESFFLYYDDVQYAKILRGQQYRLHRCKKAKYIHDLSSTTRRDKFMYRNSLISMKLFYRKNYPALLPVVVIIRVLLNLIMLRGSVASDLIKITKSK